MQKSIQEIKNELKNQLELAMNSLININETDNLLEIGIDSLAVMRILSEWIKKGYKVSFGTFIKNPTIQLWANILVESEIHEKEQTDNVIVSDRQPFNLTDVQYAYWIGRNESQYLGGVGCHGYLEVEAKNIDRDKLQKSWEVVLEAHPMMRACYTEEGKQYISDKAYSDKVIYSDLRGYNEIDTVNYLEDNRKQLSHRLMKIEKGQVAELRLSQLTDEIFILHFDIDLLICDVQSFQIILRDLAHYYLYNEYPKADYNWSFAQYLHDTSVKEAEKIELDKIFWKNKIQTMPEGPKLPVNKHIKHIKKPQFLRESWHFSCEEWQDLKSECSKYGITPAMALLTAYARTIEKWSENKKFLMNIPMFNRDVTQDIENVVADFTNIVLLEMDFTKERSFLDDAIIIQNQFHENADHLSYSGVKVLRDLQKYNASEVMAPVVFSCNIGSPLLSEAFLEAFGDISYMISQTPQIWLDFQAFNTTEGLLIIWDYVEQVFPKDMLKQMFNVFIEQVRQVLQVGFKTKKIPLSSSEKRRLKAVNSVQKYMPLEKTLHNDFFKQAELSPNITAIINGDSGAHFSYGEVSRQARAIATGLSCSIHEKQLVGILVSRGEKQIISSLGILGAGMAFVPLSKNQPIKRLVEMINSSNISSVIIDLESKEQFESLPAHLLIYDELLNYSPMSNLAPVSGEDTAYVIFTSGTTGIPKGVEMTHSATANTIVDVNKKCNACSKDVFFNVSSFDFDLSVYDVFASLSIGASLVCIEQSSWRDASKWLKLICAFNITIWNSVPTLFKMLLIEAQEKDVCCNSLRYILLSGDWIDLDIPRQLHLVSSSAKILAMGGATEAAIWSNFIIIDEKVPKEWVSIPYGKPLKGQHYRVIDKKQRDCPDYTVGELWIGGVGLSKGYLNDFKLTEDKFTTNSGSRWYRTGDLGRFWSDDTIEFLGRQDKQVKIRGHRIELGEIENALNKISGVKKSIVYTSDVFEQTKLVSYIEVDKNASRTNFNLYCAPYQEDILDKLKVDLRLSIKEESLIKEERCHHSFAINIMKKWLERVCDIDVLAQYNHLITLWKDRVKCFNKTSNCLINDDLNRFIAPFDNHLLKILSGEYSARDIVLDAQFIPVENFLSLTAKGESVHTILLSKLIQIKDNALAPLRILEFGASRLEDTLKYIDIFKGDQYVIADESQFYIQNAKTYLSDKVFECDVISLDEVVYEIKPEFDLIIVNQMLHRAKNIPNALSTLQKKLKNNGVIIVVEPVVEAPLSEISTIFLKKNYTDKRAGTMHMLYDRRNWEETFKNQGFRIRFYDYILNETGISIFVLQNSSCENILLDNQWIQKELVHYLPTYMIPDFFLFLKGFPMTSNGKIDRNHLPQPNKNIMENVDDASMLSDSEKILVDLWETNLDVKVRKNDNYFNLGGDSLLATVLRNKIQDKFGVEMSLEAIFTQPILASMASYIDQLPIIKSKLNKESFRVRDQNHYAPFLLTEMQQSYLIGRSGAFDLGDVGSHCYFEMDTQALNPELIESAWNKLIDLHPMMRAVVCEDNLHQRVLEHVPPYHLKLINLIDKVASEKKRVLSEIRKEMSSQLFDLHVWPAYDIRYSQIDEHTGRLFISFDNLFFDGWSMFRIFRQWKTLYQNINLDINTGDLSFREYVLSMENIKRSNMYEEDLKYWQNKRSLIYKAPEMNVTLDKRESSTFVRYNRKVENVTWQSIKKSIKEHEMTEPAFLMSLYAEVLARYSKHQKFSLNLTRFNRLPLSEDVNKIVGDFTTLTILSIDMTEGTTFIERAHALQRVLWRDLEHSNVNGVIVERMLNRERKSEIMMPVVFTSGLGINTAHLDEEEPYLGKIGYGLSQTPQVWLDMQVYDDQTGLSVSLDAVEGIFPEGMVEEMFNAFESLLLKFSETSTLWRLEKTNLLDAKNKDLIMKLNHTEKILSPTTLLALFKASVLKYPDKIAIVQKDSSLTYLVLDEQAKKVSMALLNSNVKKQSPVAILMKKGIAQIISIIGIMNIGGIYLPLSLEHPLERNLTILKDAGVDTIIVENYRDLAPSLQKMFTIIVLEDIQDIPLKDISSHYPSSNDIAYIIYTSGTTGNPKGVAIEHHSAVNTIVEVNHLIEASSEDKVLALSQLNFDLSVYDIFGMFECGGTIVMPEHNQTIEPGHWVDLLNKYNITIWNSVPSLLKMYIIHSQEKPSNSSIRRILLSGDWIPADIKEQADTCFDNYDIYGLGGATEASIWSNQYLISKEDSKRNSIPYGRPLANQKMYVLNDVLDDVPNSVPGQLYIGGVGLANCYWKNPKKTEESFIYHEKKDERLYRTGDMAMYSPEGFLIFLGREDNQIKINGYRVEIGEIEAAINKIENVKNCAVIFNNQLHAFIVSDSEMERITIEKALQISLPDYMHPRHIYFIKDIPVTVNAKVDRVALLKKCSMLKEEHQKDVLKTNTEKILGEIWKQILLKDSIYLDDNFFSLGGDSIKAVKMTNAINKEINFNLELREIFDNATIRKLAIYIEEMREGQVEGTI